MARRLVVSGNPAFELLQALLQPNEQLLVAWIRGPYSNRDEKVVTSEAELQELRGTIGFSSFSYHAVEKRDS